jgi:hypothetical protein
MRQINIPNADTPPKMITNNGKIGAPNMSPLNQAAIGAAKTMLQDGRHISFQLITTW